MSHSPVNFHAKSATKIINALKELGQASSKQLTQVTEMPRGSVTNIIRALREADMIHISGWEVNKTTMHTRLYKWGKGLDVRIPVFTSKSKAYNPTHTRLPWPRADIAASWLSNSI